MKWKFVVNNEKNTNCVQECILSWSNYHFHPCTLSVLVESFWQKILAIISLHEWVINESLGYMQKLVFNKICSDI